MKINESEMLLTNILIKRLDANVPKYLTFMIPQG